MDMASNGEPRGASGRIIAVRGSVVEVEFLDTLPALNEAVRVTCNEQPLILEVACHVDSHVLPRRRDGAHRGAGAGHDGRANRSPHHGPRRPGDIGANVQCAWAAARRRSAAERFDVLADPSTRPDARCSTSAGWSSSKPASR